MRKSIPTADLKDYTTACGDSDRDTLPQSAIDVLVAAGVTEVTAEIFSSGAVYCIEDFATPRIPDTAAEAVVDACSRRGCSLRFEQCKINGNDVTYFESE